MDNLAVKRCAPYVSRGLRGILGGDTHRVYHFIMTKKLVQHGNSAALILDKPILELLNVTMDTPLEITTDGRNIVVSPVSGQSESEFVASLDRINSRFPQTLRKLGE